MDKHAESDIFISYAHEDRHRVAPLVATLENRSWIVFWDSRIPIGQRFDTVLQDTLDHTRCVVVLWSESSIKSEWVSIEADEAKARGILVPAKIDEVRPPLAFRRIQTANLVGWRGDSAHAEFGRLVASIEEILSGNTAPRPAPAAPEKVPVSRKTPVWRKAALVGIAFIVAVGVGVALRPGKAVPAARKSGIAAQPCALQKTAQPKAADCWVNPADGLPYRYIPPTPDGGFSMGCSPDDSECSDYEKPAHQVTLTKGFWMAETEVPQKAYKKVLPSAASSHFKGEDLPVESVSWTEAGDYCGKVGGRLPTEAEWEWAARAGTKGARYGELPEIAWYAANGDLKTHPVGLKAPNAWGLRDMLGNVWEWVADWYRSYGSGSLTDPIGPQSGKYRVLRGGAWYFAPALARASYREWAEPEQRDDWVGFRCARN